MILSLQCTRLMRTLAATAVVVAAAPALAQPVQVTIEADQTTLAPGESTTVRIVADLDTTGQPAGIFGRGLFGFGGDIPATGQQLADFTPTSLVPHAPLTTGVLLDDVGGAGVLLSAAAGRGLDGAIDVATADLLAFTLTVASDATPGIFTLDFVGAVVLALDDALVTYASLPGPNQNPLTVNALDITVSVGCGPADINGDGNLNNSDINAFINAFLANDPAADLNPDGVYNNTDINVFINLFLQGC